MKLRKHFITLVAFSGLLILAGCGTLTIQIELSPTRSEKTTAPAPVIPTVSARPSPTARLTATVPMPTSPAETTINTSPAADPLKPGMRIKIVQLKMLDVQNGWGIGEVESDLYPHILLTQDGGKTWLERTPKKSLIAAPTGGLVASCFFMTVDEAWAVYGSQTQQSADNQLVVWHTQDGGRHWSQSQSLDLTRIPQAFSVPSDLGFTDPIHGWVMIHLGAGMSHDYFAVFVTADGGKNWQRIIDPDQNPELMGCNKTGLTFRNLNEGWLTGNCPGLMPKLFLYRTGDGGRHWTEAELPVPDERPANFFAQNSAGCGIPAIEYAAPRTLMLRLSCTNLQSNSTTSWLYTASGSETWTIILLPEAFGKLDFINSNEGWMAASTQNTSTSNGEIYHTIDGGHSWTPLVPTGWNGTPDFVDSFTGWVIARQGDQVALVITDNGGKNWKEVKPVSGQ